MAETMDCKTLSLQINVMKNGETIGCSLVLNGEPVQGVETIPQTVERIQNYIINTGIFIQAMGNVIDSNEDRA